MSSMTAAALLWMAIATGYTVEAENSRVAARVTMQGGNTGSACGALGGVPFFDDEACLLLHTVRALAGEPALPLQLNSYDPELGGINCQEPCDEFGSGMKVQPYHYGNVAACPVLWRGLVVVVEDERWRGRYPCVDSGGAIKIRWDPRDNDGEGQWEILLDMLSKQPLLIHVAPSDWHLEGAENAVFIEWFPSR